MQQETTDEFLGRERHRLLGFAVAIVLPAEGDVSIVGVKKAIVGDRYPVRVAPGVLQNLLGPAKGALA